MCRTFQGRRAGSRRVGYGAGEAPRGARGPTSSLWSQSRELCDAINAARENARYLPGVALAGEPVRAPHDLRGALDGAQHGRLRGAEPRDARGRAGGGAARARTGVPIVSATKGIENDSLMFMDEVLAAGAARPRARHARVPLGPELREGARDRLPTAVVIAAHDADVGAHVMKRFHTPYLRTYASDDVAGVECGGALKNVIAIAAGRRRRHGLRPQHARGAHHARPRRDREARDGARRARRSRSPGLAGMGDLVLTCTGELSRNRTVGYEMGRGRKLDDVLAGLGHVAEGVKTAKSAYELSRKLGVEHAHHDRRSTPCSTRTSPCQQAVRDLMARELGYEFDPRAVARATRS